MIIFAAALTILSAPVDLAGTLAPSLHFAGSVELVGSPVSARPSPYGRGAYGRGLYGGYPPRSGGRPYGIGGYGIGPYERYGGVSNLYVMGGGSGITFATHMLLPPATFILHAASGITFGAWVVGPQLTLAVSGATQILFSVHAHMTVSWDAWAPCEAGGWTTPGPCESGAWQAPGGCSDGVWTVKRLEDAL